MKNKVVHFEIGADDPEKLVEFYKNTFEWEINKYEGSEYWVVGKEDDRSEGAINGGILPRFEQNHTINTLEVEDIDLAIETAVKNGAKIVKPKAAMSGYMWWAYLADPQDNVFSVMQMDKNAK